MLARVITLLAAGDPVPWDQVLSFLVALPIALTIHEFAHAKRADLAGDGTARFQGRVTLNPLAHFDPIGTTAILLFGMGWGKPVPVNPGAFRRPRWDGLMVGFWGPLSNFIAAAVFALPLRFGVGAQYGVLLWELVSLNLVLGFFNLIPVGPLDGAGVLSSLLPTRSAIRFDEFNMRFGVLLLLGVVMFHLTDRLVGIPVAVAKYVLVDLGRPLQVDDWQPPEVREAPPPRPPSGADTTGSKATGPAEAEPKPAAGTTQPPAGEERDHAPSQAGPDPQRTPADGPPAPRALPGDAHHVGGPSG